jgi:hypothetical protein
MGGPPEPFLLPADMYRRLAADLGGTSVPWSPTCGAPLVDTALDGALVCSR